MVGTGHVDKGAIYSIAGDSKWAGSAGFEVRLHHDPNLLGTSRLATIDSPRLYVLGDNDR